MVSVVSTLPASLGPRPPADQPASSLGPLATLPHASLLAGFQRPLTLPVWECDRGYRHEPLTTTGIRVSSDSSLYPCNNCAKLSKLATPQFLWVILNRPFWTSWTFWTSLDNVQNVVQLPPREGSSLPCRTLRLISMSNPLQTPTLPAGRSQARTDLNRSSPVPSPFLSLISQAHHQLPNISVAPHQNQSYKFTVVVQQNCIFHYLLLRWLNNDA